MEDKEPKTPPRYANDPSTLDSNLAYKPVAKPVDKYVAKFTLAGKELHIGPFSTFEELVAEGKKNNVVHDRDINAAKNILAAGKAVLASGDGVRPKRSNTQRQLSMKEES